MAITRSAAAACTIGPTSVAASDAGPTFKERAAFTNNGKKSPRTERSTRTRCAEMHCWPLASKPAEAMRDAAEAGLAAVYFDEERFEAFPKGDDKRLKHYEDA